MMNFREFLAEYCRGDKSPLRITVRSAEETGGDAEVLIYGPIVSFPWWEDEVSAFTFHAAIAKLNLGPNDRLNVRINSPGGFLDEGVAMFNTLRNVKAETHVWIDGLAASAASIVAVGGDVVHMPPNARMMIHKPWSFSMGDADEHRKTADWLDDGQDQILASYLMKAPEADADHLNELINAETWLSAEAAVELGLADIVEGDPVEAKAMNIWNMAPFAYKGPPIDFGRKTENSEEPNEVDADDVPENKSGDSDMNLKDVTIDWLRQNCLDLVDALLAEGRESAQEEVATARTDGAEAERDRIKGIEELAMKGHDQLVDEAKWDGKTTPEQLAVRIIKVEKQTRQDRTTDLDDDSPDRIDSPNTPDGEGKKNYGEIADVVERAKAMWEDDAQYDGRSAKSWESLDLFTAYVKGNESGKIRVLGKQ